MRLQWRDNTLALVTLLVLAVAVAVCIPIVVELRFALLLYLLLLAAATMGMERVGWRHWYNERRHVTVGIFVIYSVCAVLAFTLHIHSEALTIWLAPEEVHKKFILKLSCL